MIRSMNIFVSGQIEDLEYVQSVQKALINAGHKITHDWTINEGGSRMLGSREDKLSNRDEAARRASNDLSGVVESDIYVICTNNMNVGKGMYVELGAALALNEKLGNPRIFLLGEMNHMSIFYFHPAIVHIANVDELIKSIS